ncbi:hypothetical protein JKP88DRAFT_247200 [Tribonema minus]|uniref:Uncharacterized protein n=1 Tax=Tribonema minus TaxID=303371 RepID=A0A835YRU7_9STRA|nr:hypothetical protein JKP88DRAFT_247200 [Tribonema minus]
MALCHELLRVYRLHAAHRVARFIRGGTYNRLVGRPVRFDSSARSASTLPPFDEASIWRQLFERERQEKHDLTIHLLSDKDKEKQALYDLKDKEKQALNDFWSNEILAAQKQVNKPRRTCASRGAHIILISSVTYRCGDYSAATALTSADSGAMRYVSKLQQLLIGYASIYVVAAKHGLWGVCVNCNNCLNCNPNFAPILCPIICPIVFLPHAAEILPLPLITWLILAF